MGGGWDHFFNFLKGLSPGWVTFILIFLMLAYRSPEIVQAIMH
jgi:hypothetical protein